MPLEFGLSNEEKVTGISIAPSTASGEPSSVEPGSVEAVVVSGDGSVGPANGNDVPDLLSGSVAGDTVFAVSADADLGSGVVTITDTVTLHVTSALATNLGLGGGSVVPK